MDIKQWARWLANKLIGVLWFIVRNPFLIIRRAIRWSLIVVFWLFMLGWGISAFAVESTPAKSQVTYICSGFGVNERTDVVTCRAKIKAAFFAQGYNYYQISGIWSGEWTWNELLPNGSIYVSWIKGTTGGRTPIFYNQSPLTSFVCPPDGKPTFTAGPKLVNGKQICETVPLTCKMGEIKTVSETTGAEICKENCASVAGQGLTGAAYNQAFLPSATVTCYGSCSVISQGTTVVLPANGFTMHGDIQFTGDKCPVTFPETGDGQPVYNDQPESSDETNAAQDQLQNAASNATSTDNAISGATGTADLNQVVDKIAEASNAQIKAMSEQNAAMGKVIEGVGKDIQGAIKQSGGGGSGASMGQLATANAIKEGNATLQEISDKLDEQQNPEPPVKPGTDLAADASGIHEANDWGQRNFGTVLTANAERFKALPVFSLPSTFFNANIAGGSCPSYTGSFTLFGTSFDVSFDAFCSQTVMNVMPYIRAVVMMLFGWLAWRIAVGNGG